MELRALCSSIFKQTLHVSAVSNNHVFTFRYNKLGMRNSPQRHGPILGGDKSVVLWQNATFEKSRSKGYRVKLYKIHMSKTGHSIVIALSRLENQVSPKDFCLHRAMVGPILVQYYWQLVQKSFFYYRAHILLVKLLKTIIFE